MKPKTRSCTVVHLRSVGYHKTSQHTNSEGEGGKGTEKEGRRGKERGRKEIANSTPVLVFQKISSIGEGNDLPLDTSRRGSALCQPLPEWQDPGFLQTTPRGVAADPRTQPLRTCKNIVLHPTPTPAPTVLPTWVTGRLGATPKPDCPLGWL